MILEIKKYGDPILEKETEEVKELTLGIHRLITDMIETMYHVQGVGLAASQVGISKKIAVVDIGEGIKVLINPKILKAEGSQKEEEGCLSLPRINLNIKRAKEIEYETLDKHNQIIRKKAKGLLARVIQHEIDHLDGKLIIDKVGFWERRKLRNLLKDIKEKK